MQFSKIAFVTAAVAASSVLAASNHKIQFVNRCGGAATMQLPGRGIFGPGTYTFNGDVSAGIAQACADINGQGCTSVEFTLVDGVSSADITLIPPHKFNHPATFNLNHGVVGATCDNPNCGPINAFYKTDDYTAQRQVIGPGSSIYIQFC